VVILHFGFWPQEAKKNPKTATRGSHEGNKFCVLNGTKHDFKKWYFVFHHSKVVDILHFGFYEELGGV